MKIKIRLVYLLSYLFMVFLSVFGINFVISVKMGKNILGYSMLAVMLYVFLGILIHYSFKKYDKTSLALSAVGGLFLVFSEIAGTYIDVTFKLPDISLSLIAASIGIFIVGTAIVNIVLTRFVEWYKSLEDFLPIKNETMGTRAGKLYSSNTYHLLIVWFVIFVCWLPCFIAAFPGVFAYDAPHQFTQFYTGKIANNQPVFSSAVLYVIINLGKSIFGTYDGGVAFFIIIQMLFGSFTLAYSCLFMKKIKAPAIIELCAVLLYALLPINPLFAVNTTKDVYFAYFVVLVIVMLLDIIYNKERFVLSRRKQALFCLLILLTLFYRNNGIYIFILFIPAFFILMGRKKWLLTMVMVCICILPYKFVTGYVYDSLNIGKSQISEAFSIPAQQMVHAFVNHGDTFSDEEYEVFHRLFGTGTVEDYKVKYHPRSSDYSRSHFTEIPDHYLELYFQLGKKYPRSYVEALLNNTLGYWYPQLHLPDKNAAPQKYIEYSNSTYPGIAVMSNRYHIWPGVEKFYKNIGNNGSYDTVPGLSMLFSIGFYSLLYLIIILLQIYTRNYKVLIPIWYLMALWGTSFAGPVVLLRYVYAIMLCLPLIAAFTLSKKQQKKGKLAVQTQVTKNNKL